MRLAVFARGPAVCTETMLSPSNTTVWFFRTPLTASITVTLVMAVALVRISVALAAEYWAGDTNRSAQPVTPNTTRARITLAIRTDLLA